MWFSYDFGGVHFVGTNTETDWPGAEEDKTGDSHVPWLPAGGFAPAGTYMTWLEADLNAAAANPDVKYIVAVGHRPFEDLPAAQSDALVALFKAAQVDYYLCGHGHTCCKEGAQQGSAGHGHASTRRRVRTHVLAGSGHLTLAKFCSPMISSRAVMPAIRFASG